ncbi:integral membrane protein GPR180 isoform X2 [Coregonus clupeaformis]|uniref:integral membrane protein GPR180 isoform X2 n=1 Tax=Coregonus clupeaformis TaxID=59861 RepID=UPI001E1C9171|nr:integral membrane protein GPR180 isoform X2 [Coregonus clupeaformis]
MYPLMFTLTAFLLCIRATFGKTVSGVFKSDAAREQNGQYITKFMYSEGSGLVVCRLENAPLATEKESRLLLFPEMEEGFDIDNLSCHDRLSKAHLSIRLSEEEHNQSIPHLHSPTAWMALYADRYTCGEGGIIPAQGDLTFTILLFNPDSAGNPLEHFSAEEAGLHSFYCLLILAYFVASCIYIQPLWMALRKGGPMHTVLKVLSTALALQGVSALFNYIHLARYARDGVGIPIMGSLAEFCDMVSQVSMLYMLLSLCVGWTLSKNRKPQSRPLQWDSSPASKALAMGGVATQGALLLWEQYEETEHHSYHAQRSIAGLLLIALRIILALLLASVLYTIISTERSALKRDFYLSFAKGCFIWFLCHPVLVLLSVVFNEHQREKVFGVDVCVSRW